MVRFNDITVSDDFRVLEYFDESNGCSYQFVFRAVNKYDVEWAILAFCLSLSASHSVVNFESEVEADMARYGFFGSVYCFVCDFV